MTIAAFRNGAMILVLVLPLFSQAFPHGLPLFLPTVFVMLVLVLADTGLKVGLQNCVIGPVGFAVVMGLVMASYVYGLLLAKGPEPFQLAREFSNGLVAVALLLAAGSLRWDRPALERFLTRLHLAIIVFAGAAAVAGLYKLFRLMQGQILSWVAVDGRAYPWGTSLVPEYNYYALTMLIGLLSVMALARQASTRQQVLLAFVFLLFLVTGMLAGSRRYWVAIPVFFGLQYLWARRGAGSPGRPLRIFNWTIGLALFAAIGGSLLFASDTVIAYVDLAWNFEARFGSLLDPNQGLNPRTSRWIYAIANLDGSIPWFGSGFEYMRNFGCEFLYCESADHPHMPLLSAFLFGGVAAVAAALLMYGFIVTSSMRLAYGRSAAGGLAIQVLALLVFSLISGNGPLDSRAFIVLGTLVVFLSHALYRTQPRGGARAPVSAATATLG